MSDTETGTIKDQETRVPDRPDDPVMPVNLAALEAGQANRSMPMRINALKRVTLETMLDVPVELVFEVGRTEITIKELLELNNGSLVDLRNVSVDTIDVRINDEIVAHSETIALKQGYGVRFGEIIALNKLREDDE